MGVNQMNENNQFSALRWAGAMSAVLLLLWLAGCASTGEGPGQGVRGNPSDSIVTASDEPENRRRARTRLELASGYFAEGKTTIALDEIKQVLVADPNFGEAFNLRGLIYMRLGDPRQAEDSFRRALQLNSRDADTLHNYAWLMCQQRRYDESIAMFTQANQIPLYSGQSKTYMSRGLCEQAAGRKADAERSFARSYELDASNPISGYNLSQLLFERGELQRAQFYIRRLNNSELSNNQTLWLGMKVERRLG
ncbi:MAG: type IV pilus biogenesis/stability protein PilW, partial [Brachymonas sp.]